MEGDFAETDEKITEQQDLLTKAGDSGKKAEVLANEAAVALRIINSVKKAEKSFLNLMFEKQMESITEFWEIIDDNHSKSEILYDKEEERIRLKDNLTEEWVDLKYSDSDGGASSGQFETALLCMALARAKQTGLNYLFSWMMLWEIWMLITRGELFIPQQKSLDKLFLSRTHQIPLGITLR